MAIDHLEKTKSNHLEISENLDDLDQRVGMCGIEWIKLKDRPAVSSSNPTKIRVADLFSGCGGLTLGVQEAARNHNAKLEVRFAADISQTAVEVFKQNFEAENRRVMCCDLGKFIHGKVGSAPSAQEQILQKLVGPVDLLVAGPPCQGHSDLNNVSRRKDERNELYMIPIRFAEISKPSAIILENVPSVIHDQSNVVQRAKEKLEGLNYIVDETLIHATSLGVPQKRKRHILVASLGGRPNIPDYQAQGGLDATSIRPFIDDLDMDADSSRGIFDSPSRMQKQNNARAKFLFDNELYDLPNELRPQCHQNENHSYRSMYGRLRWDRPAQTITTGFGSMGQGRYLHPARLRVLTPHEAARLQGFPDFFDFSPVNHRSQLHELIGNAVPPQVSAVLTDHLISNSLL